MTSTTLEHDQQRNTDELGTARARLAELTARQTQSQEHLAALTAERNAAVAVADVESKTATSRRRTLLEATLEAEEYVGAVAAAQARVAELEAAATSLAQRQQALVLITMLGAAEARATAFAGAQEAATRELVLLLRAQADCEQLARQLFPGPKSWDRVGCEIGPGDLGRVALWRLQELLQDPGSHSSLLGRIDLAQRRPLLDYWRERWHRTRARLEAVLHGDEFTPENGGGAR